MAIFLTENSKVIVQGMTGSEGRKHTQRMLASGTKIVAGVNPKKAGTSVDFDGGVSVPVFGSVAEAIKETGADVSVIFVPAAGTKAAAYEAIDAQIPLAIGWTLEGKIAPALYEHFASKDNFARELLAQRGMAAADVAAIKQGEAFEKLVAFTHETPEALTRVLYDSHHVGHVWTIMGLIGIVSAFGIYAYGKWILAIARR